MNLCERVEIDVDNIELSQLENESVNIRKSIASGYFYNAAVAVDDSKIYRTLKTNCLVKAHPSSTISQFNPRWVIFHELVLTTAEYMREIIVIGPDWLMEVAPHYFKNVDLSDKKKKKVKALGKGQMDE